MFADAKVSVAGRFFDKTTNLKWDKNTGFMGGGVFPFVFPYLNHLKWWFPSRDVGKTVKSCRIHSSGTPGFLVAVHFANVQRPATRKMTITASCLIDKDRASFLMLRTSKMCVNIMRICIYIYIFFKKIYIYVYKPCYLLITSFQVTFNPSYFAGTLTFSGFFHKSPCRLLVASTSNSFTNVRPKTRPLHENAPTVGKGSFQRVDCNYQVDIWSRVTMATLRRVKLMLQKSHSQPPLWMYRTL